MSVLEGSSQVTITHFLWFYIPAAMDVIFGAFINDSGVLNEEDEETVEFCVNTTSISGNTTEFQNRFSFEVFRSGGKCIV